MFRYRETKQIRQKIMILLPNLIRKIVRYQNFSNTQKGSSTEAFHTVRQKSCDRKSWYSSPLSHIKSTDIRIFLIIRRVLLRNVSVLWDSTISTEICDRRPNPFLLEIFLYGKLSEPQKLLSTKCFVTMGHNKCEELPPSPVLFIKCFHTWLLLNHRRVPVRNVPVLRDKTILTENNVTPLPPFSTVYYFDTRKFLQLRNVPPKNVLVVWGGKFPHAGSWYAPQFLPPIFSD